MGAKAREESSSALCRVKLAIQRSTGVTKGSHCLVFMNKERQLEASAFNDSEAKLIRRQT